MGWQQQYAHGKARLLGDKSICNENRELFQEFFTFEERKLKRQNGLRELDVGCYKTLYGYLHRLRNVNTWFKNKPWQQLTERDIRVVYDALEDGRILNQMGLPFADANSYYSKVFKSKPFRLAGKAELAKSVIEFTVPAKRQVRFFTEDTFHRMVGVVSKTHHALLFWMAWDIGENIGALLQLTKRDLIRQTSSYNNEPEYLVNLAVDKIKRSRSTRSELTLYLESVRFLDVVLQDLDEDDPVFPFGHRQAQKILAAVAQKVGARCEPHGEPIRWKDFRSSMACHLLRKGWSVDEVRARLGHKPNSDAITHYVSYLAIDRSRPKQKLRQGQLQQAQHELQEARNRERLAGERIRKQEQQLQTMRAAWEQTMEDVRELRKTLEVVQEKLLRN